MPAVYNAANEECVAAFLGGRIPFAGIVDTVAQVVSEHHDPAGRAVELADVLAADAWARSRARQLAGTGGPAGSAPGLAGEGETS
jgi:1-deoxy-D-xylulose-5-phosphate reductoisomerase